MPAIPVHHTSVDKDSAWDAGAALKNLGDSPSEAALRKLNAWVDPNGNAEAKGSYKLPHHDVSDSGSVGAANMKACASAMGRLNGGGLDVPDADRKGIHAHLAAHYKDAGMEAPEMKASPTAKHMLRMEIKEISSAGEFEGLLSVYNNVDQGRDLVEPGAFTKTIQERGGEVPLLWQHKADVPIGMLSLQDGPDALRVKGRLLMELDDAKKAYLLIKAKIVKGLSIGFETIKDTVEDGVRRLKELKLYEGSIVTFPMNELAIITSVKAHGVAEEKDFNEELSQIQLCDAADQMMNALHCALCDLRWTMDLSKADIISASETVITQFHEAYMAFLPAYLDMMAQMMGGMETMGRKEAEQKARTAFEAKAGRTHSGATVDRYKQMQTHVKSMDDILTALLEEAGSSTSEPEAADSKTSEPELIHSAAQILEDMRSLYRVA